MKNSPMKLSRCLWPKGCKNMCLISTRWALSRRLCHTHRQEVARANLRKAKSVSGTCVKCGMRTGQKNDQGEWFHRKHTEHAMIKKDFQLEEQRALETIAPDTTTLGERARYLDRMAQDAHFQTYGGESFYGPILTWRKQG